MKRILHLFFGGLLALSTWAQAPQGMSYQAVLRDGNGAIEANTGGTLGIAILQGSNNGTVVYNENHAVTSNGFGLVNVVIGGGTVVSGNFGNINWANGPYFVRTSFNGNPIGVSKLQSVPYALYAGSTNAWGLTGNAGTTGSSFIGTTDNKPLELRVNNERAGRISSDDDSNSSWGYQALNANTTGLQNVANGYRSLYSNTTGSAHVATGYRALFSNTTGFANVATGYQALYNNTTGDANVATGYRALGSNSSGTNNVATGYRALFSNTTGESNVATGYAALTSNTTGQSNVATGHEALRSNTTGTGNVATGDQALYANTTGDNNVANGYVALYSNTTGAWNVATGPMALFYNTIGDYNTAVGAKAAFGGFGNFSNTTALGYHAPTTASNQVRLGNSDVTSIGGQVGWSNLSDARFKRGVQEDVHGLDFVLKLRPVTYTFDIPKLKAFLHEGEGPDGERAEPQDTRGQESIRYTGFLAQEVEQAAKETGFTFSGVDAPPNEGTPYGLRYAEFVVPLVKAVQEQQELIERQENRAREQQAQIAGQEDLIEGLSTAVRELKERLERLEGR